jgi:four helix bundle protein
MKAGGFKNLLVWQQSMDLVDMVYVVCRAMPKEEVFGLGMQMRRSCTSVASNIAEGSGRGSKKEFIQYLRIAYGSLCELETQLLIVQRQNLAPMNNDHIHQQISSVGRLLKSLIASLKT